MNSFLLGTVLVTAACVPAFLAWWRARRGPALSTRPGIQVLASRNFGPRRGVALVEVEGERMLLGITDQQIGLLKSFALPASFDRALTDARATTGSISHVDGFAAEEGSFPERLV